MALVASPPTAPASSGAGGGRAEGSWFVIVCVVGKMCVCVGWCLFRPAYMYMYHMLLPTRMCIYIYTYHDDAREQGLVLQVRFLQRGVEQPGGHAGVDDVGEIGGEGLVAAVLVYFLKWGVVWCG